MTIAFMYLENEIPQDVVKSLYADSKQPVILSRNQFNNKSFQSIDMDSARLLYSNQPWMEGVWQSNGKDYPVDVKLTEDGEVGLVGESVDG